MEQPREATPEEMLRSYQVSEERLIVELMEVDRNIVRLGGAPIFPQLLKEEVRGYNIPREEQRGPLPLRRSVMQQQAGVKLPTDELGEYDPRTIALARRTAKLQRDLR